MISYFSFARNLEQGEYSQVEQALPALLGQETASPLIAVTHLKTLQANPDAPLAARRNLAEFYHRRWPDCLVFSLLLAKWLLEEGAAERAISLLHQAAARDISGQIAKRILGPDHPYQSLWPDNPTVSIEIVIPVSVATALGWNQLAPGEPIQTNSAAPAKFTTLEKSAVEAIQSEEKPDELKWALGASAAAVVKNAADPGSQAKVVDEDIVRIGAKLDEIAAQLDQLPSSQFDGRFPVYVLFSVHKNLVASYGETGANKVETKMRSLAQVITKNQVKGQSERWEALVFLPDLIENAKALGVNPVQAADPWTLKLSLAELDNALAKKGEMIGALLIVGGPEIVPFHNLPNPIDDPDGEVPSDNPYTTRDENYFIPDWPAGRLPGGYDNNPSLLLQALSQIRARHSSQAKSISLPGRWFTRIIAWFRPNKKSIRKGFGATAAIWRQASIQVYRPIGEAKSVLVSPPYATKGSSSNGRTNGSLPYARLAYFNLHGLADAAEWYGQRDPNENSAGADYPVALSSSDIKSLGENTPSIVFSEACYGAHIKEKSIEQALSLQFLEAGTQVIAGSTTMSYGAINAPLIAADLLGYGFWKGLQEGLSAGQAMQRAKINLASEMHQRQGYLDGEDQKTLISFVLYGDPLMRLSENARKAKYLRRFAGSSPQIKTICDRMEEKTTTEKIPPEVMSYVKQVVSNYLPGMSDANATYAAERAVCLAHGHTCPTGQFNNKNRPVQTPERHVVVLNKTMENAGHTHPQYARLTLNAQGKLVKIVVSR